MLDRGEAAAVLLLPEGFLASVQTGENKPPTLLTNPARPMEGWIAGWLGETAARILSTAQAGIYAVLAIYDTLPDPGLARETVVLGVNLRYLRAALARTELVEVETVQATGPLAVADHYTLSTLICLLLLLAPFLYPLYGGENLEPFLRRSRAIGVPALLPAALALGITWLLFWGLFWLGLGLVTGDAAGAVCPAVLCGLICAGISGLCCMGTTQAGAGRRSLGITSLCALTAGALIPPALLPVPLRELAVWSPVSWMCAVLAVPLGYPVPAVWPFWAVGGVLLIGLCLLQAVWRRQ